MYTVLPFAPGYGVRFVPEPPSADNQATDLKHAGVVFERLIRAAGLEMIPGDTFADVAHTSNWDGVSWTYFVARLVVGERGGIHVQRY